MKQLQGVEVIDSQCIIHKGTFNSRKGNDLSLITYRKGSFESNIIYDYKSIRTDLKRLFVRVC